MRPKWELNVATIIPNRFTASRVQPNQYCRKESRNWLMLFLFIASRDVKFYCSVGISFVIRCFKFEYLKERLY